MAVVDTNVTETKKITVKDVVDGALNTQSANGVVYLNGSKEATAGSVLTFDGTILSSTTVDATNVEVTNVKAKDGTAAVTIADSTGAITVASGSTLNGGVVVNETGADVDFRVEGDTDANLLFVDASTDRIGVGKNNPSTKFDVNGTVTATAFAGPINGTVGATTPSTGVFTTLTADYIYASNIVNVGSFTWNSGTSSPAAVISVGSQVITPIHTGMRRCVINDSGVVQYYLNPADSTEKLDGTAANLDGTDGQVMVEIPRFYTKFEANGTYRTWSISPVELPGYTVHPAFVKDGVDVDFRYIGAYDACVYDVTATDYISGLNWDNNDGGNGVGVDVTATTGDKLASVSGVYPMVGLTRAEFRTIAANRGAGWRQLDYTLWSAIQLLYLIEYQSFYSQNILGAGNTGTTYAASSGTQSDNGASEAGKSNSIGNASTNTTNGASSASRQVAWMSYRGIENFYGNAWNWADGVIVNAAGTVSADSATWHYTNNSADYSDSVSTNMTLITSSGVTTSNYASALASVADFFIATSVSGGSSATYTTDYFYGSTSADRVVRVGGGASAGAFAGAFLVGALDVSSDAFRLVGGRLAF
jgi:hypothetical protein